MGMTEGVLNVPDMGAVAEHVGSTACRKACAGSVPSMTERGSWWVGVRDDMRRRGEEDRARREAVKREYREQPADKRANPMLASEAGKAWSRGDAV